MAAATFETSFGRLEERRFAAARSAESMTIFPDILKTFCISISDDTDVKDNNMNMLPVMGFDAMID
jgi:hypothetical protein